MGESYLERDRDLADYFSEAGTEVDYEKRPLLKKRDRDELSESGTKSLNIPIRNRHGETGGYLPTN